MNDNSERSSDIIDFSSLWRQYVSKWYWFVISVVVCCGLAFAYIKIHKPVYQVNANLLIDDNDQGSAVSSELGAFSGLFGGKNSVDDEALILGSHSVMRSTARALGANKLHTERTGLFGLIKTNLYENYPIDVTSVDPAVTDTLATTIRFRVKVNKKGEVDVEATARKKTIAEVEADGLPVNVPTPYGDFLVTKTPAFPTGKSVWMDIRVSGYDVAAEGLSEFITVDIASKKANIIYIGYETPYPQYGCELLNELMTQYNTRGITEESVKGQKTIEFVDGRIGMLEHDLDSIMSEYARYLNKEGVASVYADMKFNYEMKGELEARLVEVQTNVEVLQMMRQFLADPANRYSLVPGVVDGSNEGGIANYNKLILSRISLEKSAAPGNKALETLDEQIDRTRQSLMQSLDKRYETAQLTLKDLRNRASELNSSLSSVPMQENDLQILLREKSTKELIFKFLLQQREESAMKIANALSKGVVVDEAYFISEPKGMSSKIIMALALVAGLLIPPVLIYFYTLLRGRFETKDEVEKFTSIPILGEVCTSKSGESLVVKPGSATSSEAELFRLIRTNLQFVMRDPADKVVLVTSTSSGEGKSFVAINLASSLSLLGKRTLLIGMDIRAGMLDSYLKLPPSRGVTEYLASPTVRLSDIIIREPFEPNLDVAVAGPVPPNPSELLASDRVSELFDQLRQTYDFIIVDSAPVGMVSDTFSLARISDATIYVCRANRTPVRDFKFINSIYSHKRLNRMGLVVNGTKTRKGYGYGYGKNHTSH